MSQSGSGPSQAGTGEAEPGRGWPCWRQDIPGPVHPLPGQSGPVPGQAGCASPGVMHASPGQAHSVPALLLPSPRDVHYPRDPLGLCCRPRRAPKLGQIGRSKKVDIEDSLLEQFLGQVPDKPLSHL